MHFSCAIYDAFNLFPWHTGAHEAIPSVLAHADFKVQAQIVYINWHYTTLVGAFLINYIRTYTHLKALKFKISFNNGETIA